MWPREESPVADALWTADMTTGPRGEELTYDERLSEILTRYQLDIDRRAGDAAGRAGHSRRYWANVPAASAGRLHSSPTVP